MGLTRFCEPRFEGRFQRRVRPTATCLFYKSLKGATSAESSMYLTLKVAGSTF
jgi:hypothetical protein